MIWKKKKIRIEITEDPKIKGWLSVQYIKNDEITYSYTIIDSDLKSWITYQENNGWKRQIEQV